ncbi:hypothetical protein GCM10010232_35150 [Streptomyces amakusaensis]|uniref:Uncharacterized protein n=1 Tax=Streptomyces amakusaensis TaxID=67271 RepID=A0ABW0AFT5_9ACTN
MRLPSQPTPSGAAPPAPADSSRSSSEATRLLCGGVYLDRAFQRGVVKELVERGERSVAPSGGVDATAVLAHALRASRLEYRTGRWIVLLWGLFLLVETAESDFGRMAEWSLSEAYGVRLTQESLHLPGIVTFFLDPPFIPIGPPVSEPGSFAWVLSYAVLSLLLWLINSMAGHGSGMYSRKFLTFTPRGTFTLRFIGPVGLLYAYWVSALAAVWNNSAHWAAVVFPLLLSIPVWAHRRAVERVVCEQLGRTVFPTRPREEISGPAWLRRIGRSIDREQRSSIILYDPDSPFAGLGQAMEPWSMVIGLDPEPGAEPLPLTTAEVLDSVKRELDALTRSPVSSASPASRSRIRDMEIDEVVYLPAGPPRDEVDHGEDAAAKQLSESIGEGGEARRHFLRIRVGSSELQMVSVLVGVQTEGETLAVEFVPHVLGPLKPHFGRVDDLVGEGRDFPALSVGRALLVAPAAGVPAVLSVLASAARAATTMRLRLKHGGTRAVVPSEGAVTSVREIAASQQESLLRDLDANRTLKTIQDRVATGVLRTMKAKGYRTGQLEQQVVQVSNGGIYITSMQGGAVASGSGARARGTRAMGAGSSSLRSGRGVKAAFRSNR